MTEKPTKLQRWLDLISFLAGRRYPVTREDIWEAVPAYAPGLDGAKAESVRRMFERDKDELRSLGIPIQTVPYTVHFGQEQLSGYRLSRRDFHLPYLELVARERGGADVPRRTKPTETETFEVRPDEAAAALDGLRELASLPAFPLSAAARSAFRKIAFDLDPDLVSESPVAYAESPEATGTRTALATLTEAVRSRRTVSFDYRAMSTGVEAERRVHPYGLLFQHGRWYLIGYDVDRGAVRMFRLGRTGDVRVADPSSPAPQFEVPEDFDVRSYSGREAWELGGDPEGSVEVSVRFAFPRSLWAERNGHGALIDESETGAQLRRFEVHRREPFLRWVLSLAGDAHVEAPGDMREAFRELAGRVAARHRDGGS